MEQFVLFNAIVTPTISTHQWRMDISLQFSLTSSQLCIDYMPDRNKQPEHHFDYRSNSLCMLTRMLHVRALLSSFACLQYLVSLFYKNSCCHITQENNRNNLNTYSTVATKAQIKKLHWNNYAICKSVNAIIL